MAEPQANTPTNSDIAAANPAQTTPSTVPDNSTTSVSPTDTPINNTEANKPSAVQQSQTASSAMATTATPPTPDQSVERVRAAEAKAPANNAPQNPQDLHASLYKNVLNMLTGQRPVIGPDGKPQVDANGKVVTRQGNVKTLGASILSGALAGMVAGFATPDKRTDLGGGRSVPDYSGAAAAGAAAGAPFSAKGAVDAAQKTADEDQARAFATADHNLKFHAMSIANDKADRESQQDVVSTWDSTRDAMDGEAKNGYVQDAAGHDIELYSYKDITGKQAMDLVGNDSLHVTRDQLIPTQVIDVPNADGGGTHAETLFSVYNPKALVSMNDNLRRDNPKLKDVGNGTPISVRVLAQNALDRSNQKIASSGVNSQMSEYSDASGKEVKYDLAKAMDAPGGAIIKHILPEIGKYAHYPLDIALDKLASDPSMKGKDREFGAYFASLGVTREGLQALTNKRAADMKQEAKGQESMPVKPEVVAGARHDIAVRNPNLSAAAVDSYVRQLGPKPNYGEYNRIMEEAGKTSERVTNQTLARTKLSDQEQTQLFNNGRVGDTKLTLENASDEMLVDQHTGSPIPWRALSKLAPTMQESNRADFADTVLKTADTLQKMQQAHVLPNGPLSGVTAEMLAKAGMSSADAGKAIVAIGLMQTATTGAHVGGRFSVPVLEKMNKLIRLNMNDSQFLGSMNEITDIMQHYKDKGGRISVKEWSEMSPAERKRMMTSTSLAGNNAGGNAGAITADLGSITQANKVPAYKDGKIVGYADDKAGTNYHPF